MTETSPRWDSTLLTLSYRLGEITLWRKQFRALALKVHFFDLSEDPLVPPPPFERLGRDADVIVTRSHPVRHRLEKLTYQNGVLRYVQSQYTRFHTELGGGFEDYLGKFSAKTRNTLRRKVKRFLDNGSGCGMREFRRPGEMGEFLRSARAVSVLTYQEKLLDAGIPATSEFAEKLEKWAESDSVRAYLLTNDDKPVAYLCCPVNNGVVLYMYLGYDPAFAGFSPGTVLQYLVLQSLFSEGAFKAFDFTEGQGEHKRFFGTHETTCADICYFHDSMSIRLWVLLHVYTNNFSKFVVSALDFLGLKSRIKNMLRRL